MLFNSGSFNVGGKPLLRLLATTLAALLVFFILRNPQPSAQGTFLPSLLPIGGRFQGLFTSQPSLSFNAFYHQYESPQDLYVPRVNGRELATESLIGKVTIMFNGRDPTYIRALQTHEVHNRRFGYPMFVLRHQILENIWSKPAYILAILLEELRKPEGHRLKWLFWVDADTVVMNPKISLDNFLPPEEYNHIHLLMTNDGHGLNNGVFFIKVHPWSVELISTVIAYPIYRPDVELEYRDQSALDNILKEKHFNKNYLLLPQRWINAYQYDFGDDNKRPWQINPGDLLVHFPGVPEGDKRMRLYADRAERHLPEWELDFQNTTYPQEIKEYWTEQHEKLAEQRDMAERAAQAAELFIKETDDQLSIHRDRMASEEIKRVEDEMKALKKSLGLNRDIEDATKTASKNLEEANIPLQRLVQETRDALSKRAYAAILSSQQHLESLNDVQYDSLKQKLTMRLDALRELMVHFSKDDGKIIKAVEDLEAILAEVEAGTSVAVQTGQESERNHQYQVL